MRSTILVLVLLGGVAPAAAQRTDILTGEPMRPRSAQPGRDPMIYNAPHAPRRANPAGESPPMEIYIAPQIGGYPGGGYQQGRRY